MKVFIINSHLSYSPADGRLNAAAQEVARDFFQDRGDTVIMTKISDGYDPHVEAQKMLDADLVILQTPIHWFSAPWIWKKYADEVFSVGLGNHTFTTGDGRTRKDPSKKYGSGGLMAPRRFMMCTTWNAPRTAFDDPDNPAFRGCHLDDVFTDIYSMFRFCGFEIVPCFGMFDVIKNPTTNDDLAQYRLYLEKCFPQKQ